MNSITIIMVSRVISYEYYALDSDGTYNQYQPLWLGKIQYNILVRRLIKLIRLLLDHSK